jgi:cytochrome P450
MPSTGSGLLYNPFSPAFRTDPYPAYRRLRTNDPVHRSPLGFWVISRYADVAKLQADPSLDFYSPAMYGRIRDAMTDPDSPTARVGRWLLFTDRLEHRRFRGLLNKFFTPAAVASAGQVIEAAVTDLLDQLPAGDPVDLMARLARPLPMNILCDWLGVPRQDRELCRSWAASIGRVLVSVLNPEVLRRMGDAVLACDAYFRAQLDERRRAPRADLLSSLLSAEHGDVPISDDELVADLILILGASSETTVNMLGMAIWSLLGHPDQLAVLRADSSVTRNAVDELLRYESPAQLAGRFTSHDLDVAGHTVPAGSRLTLLIGSANRDPERFADPDCLDLRRADPRPLSFGLGAHHCIGAWLARLEVEIALRMLVNRFQQIRLTGEPVQWRGDSVALRAPVALPVELTP